ncbi:MAG TPA: formimidoylglutamate deiminase [Cellulomonas sp.]
MSTFWCERAWLPGGLAEGVRLEVSDGRFVAVRPGTAPRRGDDRLSGVVLPGFANAHSHAFHRALRGRTHDDGGSFWTWRERMYAVADVLTPELYERLAGAVYAEMSLAGVTSVGEFHYLHHRRDGSPHPDPDAMAEALRRAAARAGVRLTLLDTCYLHGGLGRAGYRPLDAHQLRFGDGDAGAWRERVTRLRTAWAGAPDARVAAAVHSVRAVDPVAVAVVARWAQEQDVPLHVHLSEQPGENDAVHAAYGTTPAEVLRDAGALGPRTTVVHAVHLSSADIALLGGSGTGVCLCPSTERDLADGLAPVEALRAAGSPLCLGSDQQVVTDLLAEARGIEEHARLGTGRRGVVAPQDLVEILTGNGHRALGWDDAGQIVPGGRADLVEVATDTVAMAGTDPGQVVLVAGAPDVRTVVRDGMTVARHGQHVSGDVAAALHAAVEEVWSLVDRTGRTSVGAPR